MRDSELVDKGSKEEKDSAQDQGKKDSAQDQGYDSSLAFLECAIGYARFEWDACDAAQPTLALRGCCDGLFDGNNNQVQLAQCNFARSQIFDVVDSSLSMSCVHHRRIRGARAGKGRIGRRHKQNRKEESAVSLNPVLRVIIQVFCNFLTSARLDDDTYVALSYILPAVAVLIFCVGVCWSIQFRLGLMFARILWYVYIIILPNVFSAGTSFVHRSSGPSPSLTCCFLRCMANRTSSFIASTYKGLFFS
jgi:hypothetical protein